MTSVRHETTGFERVGKRNKVSGVLGAIGLAFLLSACQAGIDDIFPKEERPIPAKLMKSIKAKGMTENSPILLRIFKEENVLEVWKKKASGRYDKLTEYEICKWSGRLGPKFKEGDKQAPEGFYHVFPRQMNPKSSYHLSFNMGFPNTFDRAHDRTGAHLMVHGACSSAGCYSMTDEYVEEIYALAREAFEGGQKYFQIQAYPFKMTPENMAKHVDSQHFDFWRMLKEGYDYFELTKLPPDVDVCERRYVFNRTVQDDGKFRSRAECPATYTPSNLATAFMAKQKRDQEAFEKLLKISMASPFVAEADKPKSLSVSIMAKPTKGEWQVKYPESKAPALGAQAKPETAQPESSDASASEAAETPTNNANEPATPTNVTATSSPDSTTAQSGATVTNAGSNAPVLEPARVGVPKPAPRG